MARSARGRRWSAAAAAARRWRRRWRRRRRNGRGRPVPGVLRPVRALLRTAPPALQGQEPRLRASSIDPKGFILTNNHVVENADEIVVKLSTGKEFKAKVVGRDPKTDIALIEIKGDAKDLPAVKLGDSGSLRVGEWVVAIGNPFGLENTVTAGIVSAMGRHINQGPYDNFIQTDAAINPGQLGRPAAQQSRARWSASTPPSSAAAAATSASASPSRSTSRRRSSRS